MADLRDHQWELGGVVFGQGASIGHEADVAPASYSWRTQTVASPVSDAKIFGRDRIEPGSWAFQLFTDADDEASALAELSRIAKVWRGDAVRHLPGEVMELRYRLAGRERVVFGRPRRFDAPLDNRLLSGYIPITCDFETTSELFFGPHEESYPIRAAAPTTSGFIFPMVFPYSTDVELASRPYSFNVTGDLPTPGIFDFIGPSRDPFIEIDGSMRIQLTGTIPFGVTVTVDARPWVMSIYRADGAGVSGLLDPRTRLPRLTLTPGNHVATYGGYDETGASSGAVRWRPAYPSV